MYVNIYRPRSRRYGSTYGSNVHSCIGVSALLVATHINLGATLILLCGLRWVRYLATHTGKGKKLSRSVFYLAFQKNFLECSPHLSTIFSQSDWIWPRFRLHDLTCMSQCMIGLRHAEVSNTCQSKQRNISHVSCAAAISLPYLLNLWSHHASVVCKLPDWLLSHTINVFPFNINCCNLLLHAIG